MIIWFVSDANLGHLKECWDDLMGFMGVMALLQIGALLVSMGSLHIVKGVMLKRAVIFMVQRLNLVQSLKSGTEVFMASSKSRMISLSVVHWVRNSGTLMALRIGLERSTTTPSTRK